MKRILLPTDFSENARNAIHHALQMYGDEEVTFVLFHTYFTPHTSPDASKKRIEAERRDALERFDEMVESFEEEFPSLDLDFDKVFRYGSFVQTTGEVIDKLEIDLIAMGTQGASGLEEVWVGSSTADLISEVDCPVLAVPEKSTYLPLQKIVLALKSEVNSSIQAVKQLAEKYDAEILVLHVDQGEDEDTFKESLNDALNGLACSYYTIQGGNVPDAIEKFVREEKAEMLGLVRHEQGLFNRLFYGDVSRKMVLHTKVPLLAMPKKAK